MTTHSRILEWPTFEQVIDLSWRLTGAKFGSIRLVHFECRGEDPTGIKWLCPS
jgi:hypothetical protein